MKREIDCLIAAGTEESIGPQYLATSTILTLAKALAVTGRKTAILVIDPALDPGLVARDDSDGIVIYHSARPISTLPALSVALGRPRILILPNQLVAYDVVQTPGLDATIWLGEDDLKPLGERWVSAPFHLWADSRYVADVAGQLTQRPVETVPPPLGPTLDRDALPPADPTCIAVVGARPRDGIALTLSLARQRRDLRFIVADWPRLTTTARQQFFALAASCGNIDWRRPEGPTALLAAVATAGVILVPAMEPIGHRDWICQMRLAGRCLLGTDVGALPDLIDNPDRILPATTPAALWLQHLDRLRQATRTTAPAADSLISSCEAIAARFLSEMPSSR